MNIIICSTCHYAFCKSVVNCTDQNTTQQNSSSPITITGVLYKAVKNLFIACITCSPPSIMYYILCRVCRQCSHGKVNDASTRSINNNYYYESSLFRQVFDNNSYYYRRYYYIYFYLHSSARKQWNKCDRLN